MNRLTPKGVKEMFNVMMNQDITIELADQIVQEYPKAPAARDEAVAEQVAVYQTMVDYLPEWLDTLDCIKSDAMKKAVEERLLTGQKVEEIAARYEGVHQGNLSRSIKRVKEIHERNKKIVKLYRQMGF